MPYPFILVGFIVGPIVREEVEEEEVKEEPETSCGKEVVEGEE